MKVESEHRARSPKIACVYAHEGVSARLIFSNRKCKIKYSEPRAKRGGKAGKFSRSIILPDSAQPPKSSEESTGNREEVYVHHTRTCVVKERIGWAQAK